MNAATGTRRCRSTDPSSRILSERALMTGSTRGQGLNAGPSLALRDRLRGWMVGLDLRNACTSQVRAMYLRYRGKLPSARPRFASRDRSRLSWATGISRLGRGSTASIAADAVRPYARAFHANATRSRLQFPLLPPEPAPTARQNFQSTQSPECQTP